MKVFSTSLFFLSMLVSTTGYSASIQCLGWDKHGHSFTEKIDITEDIKNDPKLFKQYTMFSSDNYSIVLTVSLPRELSVIVRKAVGGFEALGSIDNRIVVVAKDGYPLSTTCRYNK